MELKINELVIPEKITFNYEELKTELTDKVKTYETIVYDDAQIKEAKADKANLNKLKKALNDERIRLEREYMTPFNAFKSQIADLIETIDKPVAVIDKQVKAYEEKCKEDKRAEIQAYFDSIEKPEILTLNKIFDDKWLNASVNMKQVKEAIQEAIDKVNADMFTLKALPEFSFEAIEEYKRSLDINRAIAEGQRLADIQRRKAEAEAKAKEEAERVAQQETKPTPEPEPVKPNDAPRPSDTAQWVSFKALLTVEQAELLKIFCREHKITIEPINR